MTKFAALPGLSQSHHEGLQKELARLVDEQATPLLLYSGPTEEEQKLGIHAVADNAAIAIQALWDDDKHRQETIDQLERWLPIEGVAVEPGHRKLLAEVAAENREELEKFRDAMRGSACDFFIDFRQGFFADLAFVEKMRLAALLEFSMATEDLYQGRLNEALTATSRIFVIARFLAQEKHIVPRLAAKDVRRQALDVASGILSHAATSPRYWQRLYEAIDAELLQWPEDELAWIGDRAIGLHTYELVRDGQILSLLSEEELESWSAQADMRETSAKIFDSVDSDQAFYLDTMREMIEVCRQPYFRRERFFDDLKSRLKEQAGRDDFPLVADRLLLTHVQDAHRQQAEDKARMEAWALGLATATGRDIGAIKISPVTGQPYRVKKAATHITVSGLFPGERDEPVVVPLP
jgi:hypothetical protein